MVTEPPRPTFRPRVWLRATRPQSFTATLIPVLVGTLLVAGEAFHPARFLLALTAALAIQIGANLFNDYWDHTQGLDGDRALRDDMTIQTGDLAPSRLLAGAIGAFTLALGSGLALAVLAGWWVIGAGTVAAVAAYAYTGPPLRLGYRALGEVTVFLFMGVMIVAGSAAVQTGAVSARSLWGSIPVGLLVAAILHANNIRDREDDRATGKRTLANLFSRAAADGELAVLVGGTYVAVIALVAAGVYPITALLALMTVPYAWATLRAVRRAHDLRRLNLILRRTAALHFRTGLLLSAGLALALLR